MEKQQLKNVILVTTDEKALSYKWEDKAPSIKEIQVISEEYDLPALKEEKIIFIGQQNDKEQVFVKNPFIENQYVEISLAEYNIIQNKIEIYKFIAQLLGAKSFSAKAEFIDENKFEMDLSGDVSHTAFTIDAKSRKELKKKFQKTYITDGDLKPIENFDRQRGFDEATKLINDLNFHNEVPLVGLIKSNNPALQSRQTRQKVKLQLSNEVFSLFEASFKITAMAGTFSLGANYKTTTESVNTIILDTEIIF